MEEFLRDIKQFDRSDIFKDSKLVETLDGEPIYIKNLYSFFRKIY